jgi:hypothetical protein
LDGRFLVGYGLRSQITHSIHGKNQGWGVSELFVCQEWIPSPES